MREKQPLEVTFDAEVAFDFIRYLLNGTNLAVQKRFEDVCQRIKDDANISFLASLKAAHLADDVNQQDFTMGIIAGLNLAVAVGRPTEQCSIKDFLDAYSKRGENVADIAEAFRKRSKL